MRRTLMSVTVPGSSVPGRADWMACAERSSRSPSPVVRGLDGHLNVVRVALDQAGGGDAGQLPALLQLGDRRRARVAHGGAQPADELVGDAGEQAPVGHLAL